MTRPNQTHGQTRRRFLRTTRTVTGALALGVTATGSVAADPSNSPGVPGRLYADGRLFATKDATDLPPPKDGNARSFDELYVFTDGSQFAVAEAAPGERDFNGGRWSVTTVEWKIENSPVVKSDDELHANASDITVLEEGARYFECPLVPLRG